MSVRRVVMMTVVVVVAMRVPSVSVVSPFSENHLVLSDLFNIIKVDLLFGPVVASVVVPMTMTVTMIVSLVVVVVVAMIFHGWPYRVSNRVITKVDQIVVAMVTSHGPGLRPVTVMLEGTGTNCFFEPFPV